MGSEANMVGTRYQGVQKESAGYKLLKSMGWNEGEGLGASKQGIKEHIRVKKKFENWGVGAVESHDRARDWSNNMSEFHRVLSSLSEITSKHAGSSSSSSEEDNDVASPKKSKSAEGEARKSKKKKDVKKKKAGKKDKKKESKKQEQKEEKKKASHIGRFKRREHAKMVKGYSSSDLAAILGEDPFSKQAELMAQGGTDAEDADAKTNQESTSHEENPEEENIAVVVESESNKDEYVVPEDRWWSNYFVRGPRAGSKREKSSIRKTKGFSEQDQENLFTSAHDGATTGRIGLGRSSMPKKVAGVRWQGTKTRLDDDSDDEQDVEENKECSSTDDDDDVQIKIVMPPTKKARQSGDMSNQDQQIAGVLEHLLSQETSKSMKKKYLIKGAVKHLQKDATVTTKSKHLKVKITQCLESQQSSVFAIKGKIVSLAKSAT